jgi:Serine/threonine protein phosphatase
MQIGKATDLGLLRTENEDSIYISQPAETAIYGIVADGMGGHRAGEVASTLAVDAISSYINAHYECQMTTDDIRTMMAESFFAANDAIFQQSREEKYRGMGTTTSLCFIVDNQMLVAHVGDSRIYTIGEEIVRLTKDHSLVADLVEKGQITDDEAQIDPRKNVITRAMGTEKIISVDLGIYDYRGEIVLLCSDGLTNHVSEKTIKRVAQETASLQEACDALVTMANANGGKDNISVIMMKK